MHHWCRLVLVVMCAADCAWTSRASLVPTGPGSDVAADCAWTSRASLVSTGPGSDVAADCAWTSRAPQVSIGVTCHVACAVHTSHLIMESQWLIYLNTQTREAPLPFEQNCYSMCVIKSDHYSLILSVLACRWRFTLQWWSFVISWSLSFTAYTKSSC